MQHEFIKYKGFLWNVKRKCADKPDIDTEAVLQGCYADMCVRQKGILYFIEIVQDAEIVPDNEVTEVLEPTDDSQLNTQENEG
jgi:hypothetical protein